ncbi:hypothetical protein MPER_10207, partial [Moniliophthora perniciosa FA553]
MSIDYRTDHVGKCTIAANHVLLRDRCGYPPPAGLYKQFIPAPDLDHAIAASWLVLVMVDLLWIWFFTLDTRPDNEIRPIAGSADYNEEDDHDEDEEESLTVQIDNTLAMVSPPPRLGPGPKGENHQTAIPPSGFSIPPPKGVGIIPSNGTIPALGRATKKKQSRSTDMDSTRPASDAPSDGTGTTGASSNITYSRRARVLYDYRGFSEDPNLVHLSLKKGDILSVSGASMKNNWWHAQTEDGKTGSALNTRDRYQYLRDIRDHPSGHAESIANTAEE